MGEQWHWEVARRCLTTGSLQIEDFPGPDAAAGGMAATSAGFHRFREVPLTAERARWAVMSFG